MNTRRGLFMDKAGDTAEIYLYDQIGLDSWTGDGITAKQFAKDLKALGSVKNITVKINSPGGDVFDGEAIYNELRDHPATINVRVMSLAASIASLIAMAGDTIEMQANSKIMVHKAWAFSMGNSDDMKKMANILDVIDESLVQAYVKRTGQTEAKIRQMLTAETWMVAADAVSLGFADSVIPEKEHVAAKFKLMAAFKNAPKEEESAEEFAAMMRMRLALAKT